MKIKWAMFAVWIVAFSAAPSPLPLPPGQVKLTALGKIGAATAVVSAERRGEKEPSWAILPRDGGYGLFQVHPTAGTPSTLIYSAAGLAPGILAGGRYPVIGIARASATKLHFLYRGKAYPVTQGTADERSPAWSPDGRWLVFLSNHVGRWKLYGLWLGDAPWGTKPPAFPYSDSGDKYAGAIPLFPGPGEERAPTFGPYGLAFFSRPQGSWDLWLLKGEDLSRPRLILRGVDPGSPLAWVGRRLFLVLDGQPGLLSLDGGFFRPLSGPKGWWKAPGAPLFPVIGGTLYKATLPPPPSPDLALIRAAPKQDTGELWLCELNGTGWKVTEGVELKSVAWSPDGTRIAYIRKIPGSGDPKDKEADYCPSYYELWVARADGTEPRLVLPFPPTGRLQCPGELEWSPDGGRIYFGISGSATHREIWSVDACGGEPSYHTWGWDFVCHKDGTISGITRGGIPFIYDPRTDQEQHVTEWGQIHRAFFSPAADKFVAEVGGVLALVDLKKGGATPIMPAAWAKPFPSSPREYTPLEVSWAPDGSGFALSGSAAGGSELYFYEVATGSLKKLTDNDWDDRRPVFSPDGKYLAYISCADTPPHLWILSLEDGQVIRTPWAIPVDLEGTIFWRPRGGKR